MTLFSTPQIVPIKALVPAGSKSLLLAFVPTRTSILRAKVSSPSDFFPGQELETGFDNLGVGLEVPAGFADSEIEITVDVEFVGELPKLLTIMAFKELESRTVFDQFLGRGVEFILKQRRSLAEFELAIGDGRHFFFYHIDRETNKEFLPHIGLPRDQWIARRDRLEHVAKVLWERLIHGECSPLPTEEDIDLISGIFKAAAAPLVNGGNYKLVGEAMRDFGAGWLRRVINPEPGGKGCPMILSEPDSASIFLFAEIALAAIARKRHLDFWEPIVVDLVQMQRYFVKRHLIERTCQPVEKMETPKRWLEKAIRVQLDKEPIERKDLRTRIKENYMELTNAITLKPCRNT